MPDPSGLPSLASLAARVAESLRERGETVAIVESSAGGLVSAALLAIPGASAYFVGGAVVYTRKAAKGLLGLTADDVVGMRAETEPYANLIAGKIRERLRASWGLAPGGRAVQAGRVWTNCYHAYPAHAAFGGYKQSGNGREGGLAGLKDFMEMKAISGLPA